MKKLQFLAIFMLTFVSIISRAVAVEIETDERGQIILNHEICLLAQLRLNAVAKEMSNKHMLETLWEIPKFLHDIKIAADLVARCQEQGFLPN